MTAAPTDVWEVMRTARAIRRFRTDPINDAVLARCLEAATWAPSGSNEQAWRFVVLRSAASKALIGPAFRAGWESTSAVYGIDRPAADDTSRRARMTRAILHLVDHAEEVPAFVLFCTRPTPGFPELLTGASIYPALENFLLAVRASGLGAVMSSWFTHAEAELRTHVGIPDEWRMAALVAVGWPAGRHGPVRRKPLSAVTSVDRWDVPFVDDESPTAPLPIRAGRMVPLERRTISRVLIDCDRVEADRPAVSDGGLRLSRGEFFEAARIAGGAIAAVSGAAPVAVMLDDHLDHVRAIAGLCLVGGVQVPVNTGYRAALLAHVLNDSAAETMIVDDRYVPRVMEIRDRLRSLRRLIVRGAKPAVAEFEVIGFDSLSDAAPADPVEARPWDCYGIMYTSGTTGASKGVVTTHGHAYAYASPAGLHAACVDDVSLVVMPTFHISGQLWGVMNALMSGAEAVIAGGFHSTTFWEQVRANQATFTTMAGAMARFLQRADPTPHDREHTLRRVCVAPIPDDIEAFLARFGIDSYCTGYGSTEAGSPLSSPGPRPSGSVGWPRPEWSVRIVDEHDRDVPDGDVGELVVRPEEPWLMMSSYHGRPEETARAWRNGWFHTGDGVRRAASGELYLVDRVNDVIRRRGENISSQEVEAVLADAPGVAAVAVIGVPSADTDSEVMAVVAATSDRFETADLIQFAAARLPYFMVPRYVLVTGDLPRTPTGKVRKRELRDAGIVGAWDREAAGISVSRRDD
jgi:crotonobetaine/carnitine-CoA ligase